MSRFVERVLTAAEHGRALTTGGLDEPRRQSWAEVAQLGRRVTGGLAAAGVGPHDVVAVLAGRPVDVAPVVQGIWMRGAAATMLHQPTPRADLDRWRDATERTLRMIGAETVVLGSPFEAAEPHLRAAGMAVLRCEELVEGPDAGPTTASDHDPALLQLTSGSTGAPRAVVITHANLDANTSAMAAWVEPSIDDDVMVSWLPLYHDMGMVGFFITPMQLGLELVSTTPADFLRAPLGWLRLVERHRGTITAAPNFAYAVVARRLERAKDRLDLSSLRFVLSGAEPVDPDVMRALAAAGARHGLRPTSFVPAYGMAEATLGVSFAPLGRGVATDVVDADELERRGRIAPAGDGAGPPGSGRELVRLGPPLPGMACRVLDAAGGPLPAGRVGELSIRGPAVTGRYVTGTGDLPAVDAEGWLATGDLGYLTADGEVVICGRLKDVVIVAGRNISPTDVERLAESVDGVRPGRVAAVAITGADRREAIGIVLEAQRSGPDEVASITNAVAQRVFAELGVAPARVVAVGRGALPRTPSGKVRRADARSLIVEAVTAP